MAASGLSDFDFPELVKEVADRMELNEEESNKFYHNCMTRAGYQPRTDYSPPGGKDGGSGESGKGERKSRGGWFPSQ